VCYFWTVIYNQPEHDKTTKDDKPYHNNDILYNDEEDQDEKDQEAQEQAS
jgi:hypothetical protein